MSYRAFTDNVVTLFSNTVDGKTIGNYSLGTTDPNMRFMPFAVSAETIAITGTVTVAPTLSSGITAASYVDIAANSTFTTLTAINGVGRQSLIANNLLTIAPNSQVFCRVSTAATGGTVLTIRYCIIGVYY